MLQPWLSPVDVLEGFSQFILQNTLDLFLRLHLNSVKPYRLYKKYMCREGLEDTIFWLFHLIGNYRRTISTCESKVY